MSIKIRKHIINTIEQVAESIWTLERKTITQYPEYYLSVQVADSINDSFASLNFMMEEKAADVRKEIDELLLAPTKLLDGEESKFRLERGAIDLTIKKGGKRRHLIEFKKGLKLSNLLKDARRLAWFCSNSPLDHKLETNYLVVIAHRTSDKIKDTIEKIKIELINDSRLPNIYVTAHVIKFPDSYINNTPKGPRPVSGFLVEFKYRE